MSLAALPEVGERRRFQRVKVNLLGRFMLANKREYPCQVLNMSPGGVAFVTPVESADCERIVTYIDHIGRLEGEVSRQFDGGFAVRFRATERKRDKLAAQLTWLANRNTLGLPEDRVHERVVPSNPVTNIVLPDNRKYDCKIIDMSIGGAAVAIDVRPALNSGVTLGRMRARVVRHLEDGIALEFSDVQNVASLNDHFGISKDSATADFAAEFSLLNVANG
jgi:PilZ domain-containing protein